MRKITFSIQFILLFCIITVSAFFMLNAARNDSAIFDETAHIIAGYTYLKHLDYRFNPEHPPLIKMLAGFPLLFQRLNFPTDKDYWNGLNEQWQAGNEFLYKSGNNADQVIIWSRLGPILITLLTIFFVYFLAKEIIGRWWAFLPAFLFAFSPIVLAHGHYVTTDIGETLVIMVFLYALLKFLFKQSRQNLVLTGIAFGLAQVTKFSSVLLIPYLFLLILSFCLLKNDGRTLLKYSINVALIIAIGYLLIVYPLYLLTTWNYPLEKQISDTGTILRNFNPKFLLDFNLWLAGNNFFRPFGEYLLGVLMVLQRSAGGNNAYFLGEVSSHGWRYYFPLIYLMKEPLPILLVLFFAAITGFWRVVSSLIKFGWKIRKIIGKFKEYLNTHFAEFALFLLIAIYWISSIFSPLNIGVRHILPTLPLIYILATESIKKLFSFHSHSFPLTIWEAAENFFHSIFNFWIKTIALGSLMVWLLIETSIASPYFLSYYNEFAGWRKNGFYYATDSNFDWGQDLKRLKIWVGKNLQPEEKIAIDYFGGGDAQYYLNRQYIPWWSAKGNPKDEDINWLAISANTLMGALAKPAADFYKNPADEYRWLENPYGFFDRAGTAIFIYRL